MMNNNQDKIDDFLKKKLEEFEVIVPDFPMKKSKAVRIANWLFAPVTVPLLERDFPIGILRILQVVPIIFAIIMIIPIFIFFV